MSPGDDPASTESGGEADSGGPDNEGLRLPDPGSVAEVAQDEGRPPEVSQGSGSSHQGSLVERGSSDQGSFADYPPQTQYYPPVAGGSLEVVGYSWNSPLPPASELAGYERIVPGAAERIIAMAELAVRGPIEDTAKLTDAEIDATKRGLSFAMKLTAGMAIVAVIFFALGVAGIGTTAAVTAGGVCLSIPVVMLIRSFITRS